MDQKQDRILGQCTIIGIIWLVLHLFVGGRSALYSMYHTYDLLSYFGIAVYAVVLVVLDMRLFRLNSTSAAKNWMIYWLICSIIAVFLSAGYLIDMEISGMWVLIPMFIAPFWLCYTPLYGLCGSDYYAPLCLLTLSVAHLIYFICLMRRAEKKENSHGPVEL